MDKILTALKKIGNVIYKSICLIMILLMSNSIFFGIIKYKDSVSNELSSIVLLCIVIVSFLFYKKIYYFLKKKNNLNTDKIAVVATIISFLIMILFVLNYTMLPNRDLSTIIEEAKGLMVGNKILNVKYFSMYANQHGILLIVYLIFSLSKLLHISNFINFACIFNSLLFAISIFLIYKTIKNIKNGLVGLIILIILVTQPMFYVFTGWFYSDSIVIVFSAISMYLLSTIKDNELKKMDYIKLICVGFVSFLGFYIRAVAIFPIIAYLIFVTYYLLINKNLKKYIFKLLCIIFGIVIAMFTFKCLWNRFDFNENLSEKYPITHWIMMGLNSEYNGMWNEKDVEITSSEKTLSAKKEKNIYYIKEYIKKMGPDGLIKLFLNKNNITWSYGDMQYQGYYNITYQNGKYKTYLNGNKDIFISYLMQSARILLLILFVITLIIEYKKHDLNYLVISIFGAVLFYLIWEVYPRYSLCFIPWIYIAISNYIDIIFDFKINDFKINKNKFNVEKAKKHLILLLTITIITSLALSFYKYTMKIQNVSTVALNSNLARDKYNSSINLNENTIYEQSFETNLKFNEIVLKFRKEKLDSNYSVYINLLDDNKKVICSREIATSEIKDNSWFGIKCKRINPNGKKLYLSINNNIQESNKVKLIIQSSDNYDSIPSGDLIKDDKKIKGDLLLVLYDKDNKNIMSKKSYLIIIIVIGAILAFTFDIKYKKIKKN